MGAVHPWRGREHQSKALKAKKLIYCRRIPGRVLRDDYTTSWNDQQRTKELSQKRKDMYADPLDLLIKSVRD